MTARMTPFFVPDGCASAIAGTAGPSIFLAGPTPRAPGTPSWRREALDMFVGQGFHGSVFVPETIYWGWHEDWAEQVEWEDGALHLATVILFWVPRDLDTLPGFTTNIEYGRWMDSGKCVLGAPPDAPKTGFMRYYADKLGIPQADTLEDTIIAAMTLAGDLA